jgi:hypothetical protein
VPAGAENCLELGLDVKAPFGIEVEVHTVHDEAAHVARTLLLIGLVGGRPLDATIEVHVDDKRVQCGHLLPGSKRRM